MERRISWDVPSKVCEALSEETRAGLHCNYSLLTVQALKWTVMRVVCMAIN